MKSLSDRINRFEESQTLAMTRKSRELRSQGVDVINLSIGEPDFDTPLHIKNAAKEAIDNNFTHYSPVPGYENLREAISRKFKRDNGLNYSPGQIVVSTGAKQSIMNVVLSLVNPGDEVLLPTPYWVSYIEMVKMAEGVPVMISAGIDRDFKVTPDQVKRAITPKTKLLIFSSPCNPSGSVFSEEYLKQIAGVIKEHEDIYIVADEIYEHIIYSGKHTSLAGIDGMYDKVITVNGVSKSFAMTGWRIGYIGAPEWIANGCTKIQGQFTSGASSISQMAALAAINSDPSTTKKMVEIFKKRRDLLLTLLKEVPGLKSNIPQGAFYVFPDVSYYFGKSNSGRVIATSTDLCMYLLDTVHVALVSGEAFGEPDYIRISYACEEEQIKMAVYRIKSALEKLK